MKILSHLSVPHSPVVPSLPNRDSALPGTTTQTAREADEEESLEAKEPSESTPTVKPVLDPRLKSHSSSDSKVPATESASAEQQVASPPALERDGTGWSVKYDLKRITGDLQRPTIPIDMIANLKLKGNDVETKELLEKDPRLTQYSQPTLKTLDFNFADKPVDPRSQAKLTGAKDKNSFPSPPPSKANNDAKHQLASFSQDILSPPAAKENEVCASHLSHWKVAFMD